MLTAIINYKTEHCNTETALKKKLEEKQLDSKKNESEDKLEWSNISNMEEQDETTDGKRVQNHWRERALTYTCTES